MCLKVTMVIPSYWGRESYVGWKKGDAVYDHATPLDSNGTLLRTIQSTNILRDQDFQLVVIAVSTSEDIEQLVEKKLTNLIKSTSTNVQVLLFGPSHLQKVHDRLILAGKKEYIDLLQLRKYSNIRNLCLFIPHILDSDVAVLIDDDEVFEDPDFMTKAKEFIGKNIDDKAINAVAGYYIQPDGDYHINKSEQQWMKYWDQYHRMNEAFDKVIGTEPRLKETPFAFGGNMIIHRDLFTVVPFDPNISRGEDIDFLINAKMFGYSFFLDNQLSIRHLPPPKRHPQWKQLREDIYRFIYEREKIRNQKDIDGMTKVYPEEFYPYPGCFLKNDLENRIEKSCTLMSEGYLALGDKKGSDEALNNILLAKTEFLPGHDPFQSMVVLQRHWQKFMEFTGKEEIRSKIREIIENGTGKDIVY